MVKVLTLLSLLFVSFHSIGQNKYSVTSLKTGIDGPTYSPAYLNGELVVCATQKDRLAITVIDSTGNEPSDLYVFNPKSPESIERFSSVFRTNYHDGPVSFNSKGNALVISKNLLDGIHPAKLKATRSTLGLFSSEKGAVDWSEPEAFQFNSEAYNCTHPTLSPNGDSLIFTSDMPGGFGGYDLYLSTKTEGKWSKPVNLGPMVNSSFQEVYPSIIGEKLCFSSNRTGSKGLDIYVAGKLGLYQAQRMNDPINSDQDDFGIISNNDLKSGYLSSNRAGEDALWTFEFLHPIFDDCDTMIVNNYCYHFAEEKALSIDEIPSLIYQWDMNGVKRYGVEFDYCFPGPGAYEISLDIYDTVVDQLYANQDYFFLELEPEFQPYISGPDIILSNQLCSFYSSESYLPGVTIEAYYWFVDDSLCGIGPDFNWTFDTLGEYSVRLGITGTQEGKAFKDCSQKTIRCSDKVLDTPALSALPITQLQKDDSKILKRERSTALSSSSDVKFTIEIARTEKELNILEDLPPLITSKYFVHTRLNKEDSTYSYGIGEYNELTEAYDTWREILTLKNDATLHSFAEETEDYIPINHFFELDSILFETNKSEINAQFYSSLNFLLLAMRKDDALHLIIEAHTDNVGSDRDNQKLSEDRANALKDFLIENGIETERVVAIGSGENKPIANNDSKEGRKRNRRVAFKLYFK